jgi:hypothetical protein
LHGCQVAEADQRLAAAPLQPFRLRPHLAAVSHRRAPVFAARTVAGGVFELETILKQVEISHLRHKTRRVILINHENCSAYEEESTPERHAADLRKAEQRIKERLPELDVELYYLHLTGIFEKIPSRPD